eukprot:COSAG06_NODE_17782_length_921_cov_1.996350_3_plen_46_part_01
MGSVKVLDILIYVVCDEQLCTYYSFVRNDGVLCVVCFAVHHHFNLT